ncbi:unnamed protein product, partial [Ixodes hexagonus]
DSSETSNWLPGERALQELRNWQPPAKGGTPVTEEESLVVLGRYQRSLSAACLGSCALGTTLGYASSALPDLATEPWYGVRDDHSRWFLDGLLLVAALGALASGNNRSRHTCAPIKTGDVVIPVNEIGRRFVTVVEGLPGLGMGVTTACFHSAGMSPEGQIRTRPTVSQVASSSGLLLAYAAGGLLGWEVLAGVCAVPPLLLLCTSSYLLESPYWLLRHGRQREADHAVNRLYGFQIPDEVRRRCIDASIKMISGEPRGWHTRKIAVCLSLQALHNLSCAQLLLLRNVQVLSPLAVDLSPRAGAIGMASLQLAVSSLAASLTRLLGRRSLLLLSAFVVSFSFSVFKPLDHLVLGAPARSPQQGSDAGVLVALCVLVVGHSLGLGHVPSLVMGELIPGRMRYSCSACVSAFRWLLGFLILHFDVQLVNVVKYKNSFLALSLAAFLLACMVAVYLPETEGRSLADIEKDD